ncbi:beta-lactamase-like protein [Xylariomycetidae sp. FL0641]|nr:beta-lactamase-like protein [Xylariomycetidae sp. FL0641]
MSRGPEARGGLDYITYSPSSGRTSGLITLSRLCRPIPSHPRNQNMAAPPPDLHIPASASTVNVSIINTTGTIRGIDTCRFLWPPIAGHEYLAAPCYAFLIQHPALDRTLVFDLGIRKDWWNWPPPLLARVRASGYAVDVPKHVREILDEHGDVVDTAAVEAVVWSHAHLDHTGDPATFGPGTALVVGPGFRRHLLPGYPARADAPFPETAYAGRELRELDFAATGLRVGRFPALDYFGDGSFYLLDAPGHAVGHLCGLARVTGGPDSSFVLMGGDAVHHGAELRPHPWHPLPEAVAPHPFAPLRASCPGALFAPLLRGGGGDRARPFYLPAEDPPVGARMHHDVPRMIETIRKLQELDAHDNILVVPAHDVYMLRTVDFFPATANDFVRKGWVHKARWAFLADFAKAVGYEGELPAEARGEWGPVSEEQK